MRVALDVDEVLADFVGASLYWAKTQAGVDLSKNSITGWDVDKFLPESHRAALFDLWNAPGFCATLPLIREFWGHGVQECVKTMRHYFDVRCLTTPMKTNPHWKPERLAWLKNLFGFSEEEVIFAKVKHDHAADFDVLIDDKAENVVDWTRETGKPAILMDRPWNKHVDVPHRAVSLTHAISILHELNQ